MNKSNGNTRCFYCYAVTGFTRDTNRPDVPLAELCSLPLKEVRKALYGEDAKKLDFSTFSLVSDDDFGEEFEDEIEEQVWTPDFLPIDDPMATKGAAYLAERGIPLDVAVEYRLRYSRKERRVGFPIVQDGKMIGWQARTIVKDTKTWDEKKGKYFEGSKILTHCPSGGDSALMFSDRVTRGGHLVLCEGPVDAMKAHLCGGNVATMGKGVTRAKLALIKNLGVKKVYLALDPDAAAETARLAAALSDYEIYVISPPPGYKDLGEMSFEQVHEAFLLAPRASAGQLFVYLGR